MSAIDNYFWEVESESLNLISPYEQIEIEYKMATVMLKRAGLNIPSLSLYLRVNCWLLIFSQTRGNQLNFYVSLCWHFVIPTGLDEFVDLSIWNFDLP